MYSDTTEVDINICNQALMQMGGKRITAFDQSSTEARDCEVLYATLRDEVLEAFPWTFAKGRETLERDTSVPDFGYSYQYCLPSCCLSPLYMDVGETDQPEWEVEGDLFLTDEEEVNLVFIERVEDPDRFTPSFIRALSLLMASRLAMSVAKNAKLAAELEDKYIRYIEQDAMTLNGRTGRKQPDQPSTYADAR